MFCSKPSEPGFLNQSTIDILVVGDDLSMVRCLSASLASTKVDASSNSTHTHSCESQKCIHAMSDVLRACQRMIHNQPWLTTTARSLMKRFSMLPTAYSLGSKIERNRTQGKSPEGRKDQRA